MSTQSAFPRPSTAVVLNGVAYLSVVIVNPWPELWKSDGTTAGTVLVADIWPALVLRRPPISLCSAASSAFAARDSAAGREIWRTDGTTAGTERITDIVPGTGDGVAEYVAGNYLFFRANDSVTGELYRTDNDGGHVLIPIFGRRLQGVRFAHGDKRVLYFTADDTSVGRELWRSEGTLATTSLVRDIRPGPLGSGPEPIFSRAADRWSAQLTVVGATLFLLANNGSIGIELFQSDGTEMGMDSSPISIINIGSFEISSLTATDSLVSLWPTIFSPAPNFGGRWNHRGNSARRRSPAAVPMFRTSDLTGVGNLLFFVGDNGATGRNCGCRTVPKRNATPRGRDPAPYRQRHNCRRRACCRSRAASPSA